MRTKKYIVASFLFCFILFGITVCASAKVKSNGEYQYQIIKSNSIYMHTSENVFGDIEQGIFLCRYLGNETEVKIPKEIDGLPVIFIGYDCFEQNETIQKVTIPGNVRWVDGFSDCINLKEVSMEDGVRMIGSDTFSNCTSLEKINMPDTVRYIGGFELDCTTFSGCTSLKEICLPKNLERMDNYAFSGCSALEHIELPDRKSVV